MLFRHGRRYLVIGALALGGCGQTGNTTPPPARTSVATRPTLQPPAVRTLTLGHSVEGRPITLHLFGDTAVGPANTVLIFGGIHGNEPTSAGVSHELVKHLTTNPGAWSGRCVAVIPEANPDGLHRGARTNKNLVDLNRNFPAGNWTKTRRSSFFGGDAPATEPETLVLMSVVEQLKPARIIAVHSMAQPCNNFDGPGETLATAMAAHNGYPVKSTIGYATPGSFGSWAGGDRQIPVITLELPSRGTTDASWKQNREALLAVVRGR